jgi:hypothetical protein
MPIIYYPDSLIKKNRPVVEQLQVSPRLLSESGQSSIASADLNKIFWKAFPNWSIESVGLKFSVAGNKTYAIYRVYGRGIITGLNDTLWFKVDGSPEKEIIIPQNFYTGAELAVAIKEKLDTEFPDQAAFTVSYSSATGIFTIAPGSGQISYLHVNPSGGRRLHSTAESVIGFLQDKDKSSSLTSDSAVMGLGDEFAVSSGSLPNVCYETSLEMNVDYALKIHVAQATGTATWATLYKEVL